MKLILMGKPVSGKSKLKQLFNPNNTEQKQDYIPTRTIEEDTYQLKTDTLTITEWTDGVPLATAASSLLSSSSVKDMRAMILEQDAIVRVIQAEEINIQKEIETIKNQVDQAALLYANNKYSVDSDYKKPVFFIALNVREPEQKDGFISIQPDENKIFANARLIRDQAVKYAQEKGFVAECLTYVPTEPSTKNLLNRIRSLVATVPSHTAPIPAPVTAVDTLEKRIRDLYAKLNAESGSFFSMNRADKAIKLRFLRKVLHTFEEMEPGQRNDFALNKIVHDQFVLQDNAEKLILKKGLMRSRVNSLLSDVLTVDDKYLTELIAYRNTLLSESGSKWPYPNKDRKDVKANFLTKLIDGYTRDGKSLNDGYNDLIRGMSNDEASEITAGIRSEVKGLLDNIPGRHIEAELTKKITM